MKARRATSSSCARSASRPTIGSAVGLGPCAVRPARRAGPGPALPFASSSSGGRTRRCWPRRERCGRWRGSPTARRLLQPGRDVGRVAGELGENSSSPATARLATTSPVLTPDPDRQPLAQRGSSRTRSRISRAAASAAVGVVAVGDRQAEDGHDRIADELLDRPAVVLDALARDSEEAFQERADVLGIELSPSAVEPATSANRTVTSRRSWLVWGSTTARYVNWCLGPARFSGAGRWSGTSTGFAAEALRTVMRSTVRRWPCLRAAGRRSPARGCLRPPPLAAGEAGSNRSRASRSTAPSSGRC